MSKIRAYLNNNKTLIKLIVIALLCSSCSINKHGVFVGFKSQEIYNKSLQIQQNNAIINEVTYAK